jgi:CubicO group peptidase (beta-lactamase class C family)
VDPRFSAVQAAFTENFISRHEIGASLCIEVDGTAVVDLWGGWQDEARTRPWLEDTLVNVFSVGKAIASICVARLVSQGVLHYDQAVAEVWPDFAENGKSDITVRQLLSHQAGLPAVRAPLTQEAIFDWTAMCQTLAAHRPWWEPGTAHGYHVNTFGFLVGELVRRSSGLSLGTMVARDVAGPLEADFFIGLPDAELHRVADYLGLKALQPPVRPDDDERLMEYNAYFNPVAFSGTGLVNTTRWRQAEMPSTNGHATGRGIMRIFAALLADGRLVERAVLEEATSEEVHGDDVVLKRPSRFGLGFQLTQAERPLGPNPRAFGHFGAGGSLGFCDPDASLAFGYAINTMGPRWQNPRNRALIETCYSCL